MTKKDKLIEKFLAVPVNKNLTFHELSTLLKSFGYRKLEGSGSRVAFYNDSTMDMFRIHKPHPSNVLKTYVVKLVQSKLKSLLEETQ